MTDADELIASDPALRDNPSFWLQALRQASEAGDSSAIIQAENRLRWLGVPVPFRSTSCGEGGCP